MLCHFLEMFKKFIIFGSSLNRWAELALSADMHSKLKLKKLCTTRWTSRIDAVRAIRNRYSDILKVMCQIILLSKNKKERDDACALKKKMESFEFVVFIVLWERVLNCINKASLELQSKAMDLSRASRLLSMAHGEMTYLRNS